MNENPGKACLDLATRFWAERDIAVMKACLRDYKAYRERGGPEPIIAGVRGDIVARNLKMRSGGRRIQKEAGEHFEVYAIGICSASICTNAPIDAAVERMNAENPTGISSRWTISPDGTFKSGQPNGCPCDAHRIPGARHWLLNC